jgi:hypothetical protein
MHYDRMIGQLRVPTTLPENSESVFSSYAGPELEELYYDLDSFFEAIRATHDASLSCLGSAGLLKNPPNSLHAFQKKEFGKVPDRDSEINGFLIDFWGATGSIAKDYRDCLTHFVSFSGPTWQHAANAVWNCGKWNLSVVLPDNPKANSYSKLRFDGCIDALSLCSRINHETNSFLNETLTRCAKKWNAKIQQESSSSMTLTNVRIGS